MTLLDIKNYMTQVKFSSLAGLAAYFGRDADLLRCMLQHWIQKGKIRACQRNGACGKCQKCPAEVTEVFEWI